MRRAEGHLQAKHRDRRGTREQQIAPWPRQLKLLQVSADTGRRHGEQTFVRKESGLERHTGTGFPVGWGLMSRRETETDQFMFRKLPLASGRKGRGRGASENTSAQEMVRPGNGGEGGSLRGGGEPRREKGQGTHPLQKNVLSCSLPSSPSLHPQPKFPPALREHSGMRPWDLVRVPPL